jgi:hypothetical protein
VIARADAGQAGADDQDVECSFGHEVVGFTYLPPSWPGFVPAIHVFASLIDSKDVDARHKAGHDEKYILSFTVIPGRGKTSNLSVQATPGNLEIPRAIALTRAPESRIKKSIPVMIRLERAFRLHADIVGLVLRSSVSFTPILARCSRATFSSSDFGST